MLTKGAGSSFLAGDGLEICNRHRSWRWFLSESKRYSSLVFGFYDISLLVCRVVVVQIHPTLNFEELTFVGFSDFWRFACNNGVRGQKLTWPDRFEFRKVECSRPYCYFYQLNLFHIFFKKRFKEEHASYYWFFKREPADSSTLKRNVLQPWRKIVAIDSCRLVPTYVVPTLYTRSVRVGSRMSSWPWRNLQAFVEFIRPMKSSGL